MSSSDHGSLVSRRAGTRGFLFAMAAWALAACTVQPLYGPAAGGGSVQAALTKISVDPVDDRVSQQVRNNVIFQMAGGKPITDPIYRMKLTVTSREIGFGITDIDSSLAYSVQVAATYEVTKIDTGEQVARGTARSSASYNRVNQAFANTRAKIDAENRAANSVADEIATRVAVVIAKGA
jgi:LPS-assembly lipoprotein